MANPKTAKTTTIDVTATSDGKTSTPPGMLSPAVVAMARRDTETLAKGAMKSARAIERAGSFVSALQVRDQESFLVADDMLGKIKTARKEIRLRIHTTIIEPVKRSVKPVEALYKELDGPLEALENDLKDKATAWQAEERRKAQAKEAERQAEIRRLAAEAERKQLEAQQAAGKKQTRLEAEAEHVLAQAQMLALRPQEQATTKGASSTTRFEKKIQVTDKHALILAVAMGEAPEDLFLIDNYTLRKHWMENRERVMEWPGVDEVEEPIISARGK